MISINFKIFLQKRKVFVNYKKNGAIIKKNLEKPAENLNVISCFLQKLSKYLITAKTT